MKKLPLLSPFVFALTALLFTYVPVSTTISPAEMLRPLTVFWLLLAVLVLPVYLSTKDWNKTSIILTVFSIFVFFQTSLFLTVLILITGILFTWHLYTKRKRKRGMTLREAVLLLNILSFALAFGGSLKLIQLLSSVPVSYAQTLVFAEKRPRIAQAQGRSENPDIYYIVLDGYARADVLDELFGFDNSDFIETLKEKDFIIPTDNHSNYPKTTFSIASMLNMDYVQSIAPNLENSYFWWLMSPLIDHSQTRLILEEIGYESISMGVDWTITDNHTTDIYYSPSLVQVSEFENYVLHNTLLGVIRPLLDKVAYIPSSYDAHRELIRSNFSTLPEIAKLPGAQFVFVHFLVPHPPFVFDMDGNEINPEDNFSLNDDDTFQTEVELRNNYRQGYSGQVAFVNQQLIQAIDAILENSSQSPIIILQADHGSGMYVDFSSAEKTCLYERFSPFAAYYFPGMNPEDIPSDITPVNLFRIIFNQYFGTDLPLLENAFYFSKDFFYLYQLGDITLEQIEASCNIDS